MDPAKIKRDEAQTTLEAAQEPGTPTRDIEHALVSDDPRLWSETRKYATLVMIASAGLIATFGVNIFNPALHELESDLHASDQEIALALSLFIITQGCTPLLWSAVSEIKGRKYVYLISILLYIVGCAVGASARRVSVLIAMRVVQALGGSAVLAIGAATLADIYEPRERGRRIGIYHAIPLVGPSLGPLLGGLVTNRWGWRATFWTLVILGGCIWLAFLFFKDTFRRERSAAYQGAIRRARAAAARYHARWGKEKDAESGAATPNIQEVKLSLVDVNPVTPLILVLRRRNNIAILIPSALIFAFSYSISYTCARTFSAPPYNYNALKVGLVLLSFGIGNMAGSILGGRWSDRILAQLKAANGGESSPEMRLQSTKAVMLILPPSVLAYAWLCEEHVHVAAVCAALVVTGFASIWIYSSTLAHIVDANVGRSSTAVATNSAFRGIAGFVAAEIAAPLQKATGDGGLYTIWAGLLIVMELIIVLVAHKGGKWRERAEQREADAEAKSNTTTN